MRSSLLKKDSHFVLSELDKPNEQNQNESIFSSETNVRRTPSRVIYAMATKEFDMLAMWEVVEEPNEKGDPLPAPAW